MTTCLDDDDLARFVGEPATSAWRAVRESHIDTCGACRARVALALIELGVDAPQGGGSTTAPAEGPPFAGQGSRFRWAEGDRIGGHVLLEELGRGGMGVVFAAREVATGAEHALKFLLSTDAKHARRLLREARAMQITHPAIVPVERILHDVDVGPVLVMPRLRGTNLAARILGGARPTLEEAGRIVARLLEALDVVHRLGAVHRDVKPGNVFVEDGGAVRLLDFGLVWLDVERTPFASLTQLTTTTAVVGTPRYLAPEVVHGARADARSDLWGVGHVAFESLTGDRAVRGAHTGAILRELSRETPLARADERDPRVPRPIADVVATLLTKDASARAPSAEVALGWWRHAFATSGIAI